jgi:hypothetical protein
MTDGDSFGSNTDAPACHHRRQLSSEPAAARPSVKNRTYGLVTPLNTGHFVTQVEVARRSFSQMTHTRQGGPPARLLNQATPCGPPTVKSRFWKGSMRRYGLRLPIRKSSEISNSRIGRSFPNRSGQSRRPMPFCIRRSCAGAKWYAQTTSKRSSNACRSRMRSSIQPLASSDGRSGSRAAVPTPSRHSRCPLGFDGARHDSGRGTESGRQGEKRRRRGDLQFRHSAKTFRHGGTTSGTGPRGKRKGSAGDGPTET